MDEKNTQDTLSQGQIIVAEFRVEKDMTWDEAQEQIRTQSPESFKLTEVALRENYTPSGTH